MFIVDWFLDFIVASLWAIATSINRIFGLHRNEEDLKWQLSVPSWTTLNTKAPTRREKVLEWIDNVVPGPPEKPPKRSKCKSSSRKKKAKKSRRQD